MEVDAAGLADNRHRYILFFYFYFLSTKGGLLQIELVEKKIVINRSYQKRVNSRKTVFSYVWVKWDMGIGR